MLDVLSRLPTWWRQAKLPGWWPMCDGVGRLLMWWRQAELLVVVGDA
ncbi:hypothetical protein HDA44_002523 [Kribbella solani]|uniref:Uncharacterized protein n=1 Tax=Kribbella solani TaxID=236067 RepID=A0A841DKX5_9ACTN|nr:hypothetical protein [Kribbella solani]